MIAQNQALGSTEHPAAVESRSAQRRLPLTWRLGNLLLLSGLYLLLYVGGLYADSLYEQWAARGDNELQPAAVDTLEPSEPNAFVIPVLNQPNSNTASTSEQAVARSTVTRLVIPKIALDSKVIEVGWETIEQGGKQILVWQVAKYAVGQHKGSSNPGEGGNVVMAGHVGGEAPVFRNLIELEVGDQLTLFSEGRQYLYVVRDKVLVQEVGVSEEQRLENAQYIAPTPNEVVTLVTCWPPTGPNKFDQRLIIRAEPFGADMTQISSDSSWTPR